MEHRKAYKKLGRKSSHRIAMLNNMCCSLILNGKVVTTVTKAKELKTYVEKNVITPMKRKDNKLVALRSAHGMLRNKEAVVKLLQLAEIFDKRQGGYSRVVKLGHRNSDKTDMALIEFVQ